MRAPFPWFGGKSRAAPLIWRAFGEVPNYVEPFAGSLAVLLARPGDPRIETVNDLDCYLANFWRATQLAPAEVAHHADWPVNEIDLHARHRWLVGQTEFRERMRSDPEYFDARIAGWWVWGLCQWIGGGWCAETNWNAEASLTQKSGRGKATAGEHRRPELLCERGVMKRDTRGAAAGWNKRPSLGKGARGVQRLAPAEWSPTPSLRGSRGAAGSGVLATGLYKKMPGLGMGSGSGSGVHAQGPVFEWMATLADRLRRVRVCCGDWKRVLGPSATTHIGVTGILFDPPYQADFRDPSLYGMESATVSAEVRAWCIENGENPKMRLALCGYEGEHEMPDSWQKVAWKAPRGMAAADNLNSTLERVWFSPHCRPALAQGALDL